MATVLDFEKLTVSTPAQVGDGGLRLDGLAYQNTPILPEGIKVWDYRVTANEKLTAQSLIISLSNAVFATGQAPGTPINGAVWKIRQTTTDKFEGRLHAFPIMGNTPGGDELVVYQYNANQQFGFGEGVVFTTADTFRVSVTPAAANAGVMYCATAVGRLGATPDVRKGILTPSATTADQVVLEYNPPSDWTCLYVTIEAVCFGSAVCAGARLELNGMTMMEFPPMGQADSDPVFMGGAINDTKYGVIHLPFWGIEFKDGDYLALYAQPYANAGHIMVGQLSGDSVSYGGGGGNTYSRSRVVNP